MDLLTILKEIHSGSYGNSYGDGSSTSNGYGDGYGDGDGDGIGGGCGFGDGYGDDRGVGHGNGWGNGNGWGDGWGNGNGNGSSNGDGGPGIDEIDGMKVYIIDNMPTVIETVFGAYAKGYTISYGVVLTPCYVAMDGGSLAHGKTLKEAFCDVRAKEMKKLPEDERVKHFVAEHPDSEENLPNEEFFTLHHILTGSCEFGRREFCRKNNINLKGSMNISKFITLTENEYGGEVIGKIRKEYLRRG